MSCSVLLLLVTNIYEYLQQLAERGTGTNLLVGAACAVACNALYNAGDSASYGACMAACIAAGGAGRWDGGQKKWVS